MQVAKHGAPNAISRAVGYAKHRNRSHDAVMRVYDEAGNVIEKREQGRVQTTAKYCINLAPLITQK